MDIIAGTLEGLYCPGCGVAVTEDDNICPGCGAEFEDEDDDDEEDGEEDREEGIHEREFSEEEIRELQQQIILDRQQPQPEPEGVQSYLSETGPTPSSIYDSILRRYPHSFSSPSRSPSPSPQTLAELRPVVVDLRPANEQAQTAQPQPAAPENMPVEIVAERYDRQARITGWNQKKLGEQIFTIIGYNTFSEYLALSASALGVKKVCIIATPQDLPSQEAPMLALSNGQARKDRLAEMMKKVGSADLECLVAGMTSKPEKYFLLGSDMIIDATGRHESRALALEFMKEHGDGHAELVHFYEGGFLMLSHKDNPNPLYGRQISAPDTINAMLAAGVALDIFAKSVVFEKCERKETVVYEFPNAKSGKEDYAPYKVLLIGAGALGNFVGQGLAALGFNLVDILDFDTIETTNLNRQLLFYGSVGQQKAKVLAERCAAIRGPDAKYEGIVRKFDEKFGIEEYDLVIDCVDNVATRALISKKCVGTKVPLVSAGTSYNSGQATAYIPGKTRCTDHSLGWSSQAEQEAENQARIIREGGCLMQPNPSVIMSNQVMAAIMLNMARQVFHPDKFGEPASGYRMYRADSPNKFGWVGLERCVD